MILKKILTGGRFSRSCAKGRGKGGGLDSVRLNLMAQKEKLKIESKGEGGVYYSKR